MRLYTLIRIIKFKKMKLNNRLKIYNYLELKIKPNLLFRKESYHLNTNEPVENLLERIKKSNLTISIKGKSNGGNNKGKFT